MFRNLYIYLVLFTTLMMTIGGSVGIFMSAADYFVPTVHHYQTFEEYKIMMIDQYEQKTELPNDEELRKSYEQEKDAELKLQKQHALSSMIKSIGWIVIPLPIFLYFQSQLKRKRQEEVK